MCYEDCILQHGIYIYVHMEIYIYMHVYVAIYTVHKDIYIYIVHIQICTGTWIYMIKIKSGLLL